MVHGLDMVPHTDKCLGETAEQKVHFKERFQELSLRHTEARQQAAEAAARGRAKALEVDMVDVLLMLNTFQQKCEAAARVLEDDVERLEGEMASSCLLATKQVRVNGRIPPVA